MSELPPGWVNATFADVVVSFSNGIGGDQNKEGIGIPVSRIETIADQSINFKRVGYLADYDSTKISKYLLKRGDILFSHINSPVHLGKTAIFEDKNPLYHGINLLRIVVNREVVYPEIFNYFCKLTRFQGEFAIRAQHAVNQSSINQKKLGEFDISIAPLPEQKRIADKLDAVLARVDACRDRLDRIPAILKRFRQSVLAAATSGKLTEEWRSPATDDQDDSSERGRGAMGEGPFEIPSGWEWKSLADITINFDGRRVPIKASDRAKRHGQYKYYGAFGVIDTIDDFLFDGEFLLLAEDGKNLESRDRAISLVANGKFWVNNHAHVMQAKPGMVLAYMSYWINSTTCDLSDLLTGIDQVKLTRGAMDRIPVPVPSPEEQNEIVRRVEVLFACADRLEVCYTAARTQVEKLIPSTLAKAFRGELVPQDPSDEPASVLLERVRTKHNDQSVNKPKRGRQSPQTTKRA